MKGREDSGCAAAACHELLISHGDSTLRESLLKRCGLSHGVWLLLSVCFHKGSGFVPALVTVRSLPDT